MVNLKEQEKIMLMQLHHQFEDHTEMIAQKELNDADLGTTR